MIIGYQGIENSYNDFAVNRFIEKLELQNVSKEPLVTSDSVARALIDRNVDLGVIALKNNIAGSVEESENIMKSDLFEIVDTTEMSIKHCLFAFDENSVKNIKTIASHIQALKQCSDYLKSHFPHCKLEEHEDTAKTASDLKNGILEKTVAVICSKQAGEQNNLFLISENITNRPSKTTFCLISLKPAYH